MTTITETLCTIERRADRAVVQELRLMTQEILAMRTQLRSRTAPMPMRCCSS